MTPVRSLLFALVFLTTGVVCAADGIGALTRFYEEVDSLSARFEQVQLAEDGAELRRSNGIFLLSRPGRFRWEYQDPDRQIIVSDGETFMFYDVGLDQVTVRPVADTLQATPAQLLTGGTGLQDAFVVHSDGEHDGLSWLRLIPRSEQSDFEEVRLGLRDGLPVTMELDDRLGQMTRIEFSDIEVDPVLDAARFAIDIPDDATVVDQRESMGGQDW